MDEASITQYIAGTFAGVDDFAALDQILPHPVYASQSWICMLNPSEATFQAVQPLLAEAYDLAVRRYAKVQSAEES